MSNVGETSTPIQVLIADDNPANLGTLFDLLSREGFEVAVANDGGMVLELLNNFDADIILLDVQMPPGMDGFEACKRLKEDPRTRSIPVIFMTSLDDRQSRLQGFSVGAADFVTKPFEEAELLARMRTHIALRQMTRALEEKNARLEEQIRMREAAETALAERSAELELQSQEMAAINEQLEQRALEFEALNEQLGREFEIGLQHERLQAALQEEIIAVQKQRLEELSVPLIPVTNEVLVMPLIGSIDEHRLEQIINTVLNGTQQKGAEFVIIDMTGVTVSGPHLPEMVARVANGLRLLGARTILTGLRAESAQYFATMGVTFGHIVTKANLQDGIAHALHIQPEALNGRTATQAIQRGTGERRRKGY
ncbi:MAG TPA: response regulator [Polyangium sp.]|nr:response regulator [Polyangium sp.]